MKRSSTDAGADLNQIAKSVRALVEAFLLTVPGSVGLEFAERIEKLAHALAQWGSKMNLTAHPDDLEEIAFHIIDSLMPVTLAIDKSSGVRDRFAKGRKILDLGSGAGFPGLVLAAASSADFTLVESRRKRASFLQFAVVEMGLKNVTIETRRAQEIGLKRQYSLVTARAFGDPKDFFALAAKALKPGGLAMLYASPSQRLGDYERINYSVARRGERIDRILALWRPA